MFTSLLKNMVKDTDEEPDKEMHRARSFWPHAGGMCYPPDVNVLTNLEIL